MTSLKFLPSPPLHTPPLASLPPVLLEQVQTELAVLAAVSPTPSGLVGLPLLPPHVQLDLVGLSLSLLSPGGLPSTSVNEPALLTVVTALGTVEAALGTVETALGTVETAQGTVVIVQEIMGTVRETEVTAPETEVAAPGTEVTAQETVLVVVNERNLASLVATHSLPAAGKRTAVPLAAPNLFLISGAVPPPTLLRGATTSVIASGNYLLPAIFHNFTPYFSRVFNIYLFRCSLCVSKGLGDMSVGHHESIHSTRDPERRSLILSVIPPPCLVDWFSGP